MTLLCRTRSASRTEPNHTFKCLQTAFGGLVATTLRIGTMTPLAPVCLALELARERLVAVRGCKERLEELHHKCELITTYVILQNGLQSSQIDITPLKDCVDELNDLAQTYADQSICAAYLHLFVSGGNVGRLERGIDTVLSVMNLAVSTRIAIAAEDWTRRVVNLVSAKVLSSQYDFLSLANHDI